MKRIFVVILVFSMMLFVTACTPEAEAPNDTNGDPVENGDPVDTDEPPKAALVISGPISDGGWNESAHEGLKLLRDEHGFEIAYTEHSTTDTHVANLREYANAGYDLIIGHGFEFEESIGRVAEEYPDVHFAQVGGVSGDSYDNVASGVFRAGEMGYLGGLLAGELTQTGKVAFIGSFEIPTIAEDEASMEYTLRHFYPDVSMETVYIGSWTDVALAEQTAVALIAQGVDVIFGIGDNIGVGASQATEASGKDVWYIDTVGDRLDMAPNTYAGSIMQQVPLLIEMMAEQMIINGEPGTHAVYGIPEGVHPLGRLNENIPEDIRNMIIEEHEKFLTGEQTLEDINEIVGREPDLDM